MSQVKIYGLRSHLTSVRARLSEVIHECIVEVLKFPENKRAHRFIHFDKEDFYYPKGRTDAYTIIEILMIEGRKVETKKQLIHQLFARINQELGIEPNDIEVCIFESPASNWGFRGKTGDEIKLNYNIEV